MTYKRQYRELDDRTKEKISAAAKGKHKAAAHKEHISQAMKDYWRQVPHKPTDLPMDDYLGKDNHLSR